MDVYPVGTKVVIRYLENEPEKFAVLERGFSLSGGFIFLGVCGTFISLLGLTILGYGIYTLLF